MKKFEKVWKSWKNWNYLHIIFATMYSICYTRGYYIMYIPFLETLTQLLFTAAGEQQLNWRLLKTNAYDIMALAAKIRWEATMTLKP